MAPPSTDVPMTWHQLHQQLQISQRRIAFYLDLLKKFEGKEKTRDPGFTLEAFMAEHQAEQVHNQDPIVPDAHGRALTRDLWWHWPDFRAFHNRPNAQRTTLTAVSSRVSGSIPGVHTASVVSDPIFETASQHNVRPLPNTTTDMQLLLECTSMMTIPSAHIPSTHQRSNARANVQQPEHSNVNMGRNQGDADIPECNVNNTDPIFLPNRAPNQALTPMFPTQKKRGNGIQDVLRILNARIAGKTLAGLSAKEIKAIFRLRKTPCSVYKWKQAAHVYRRFKENELNLVKADGVPHTWEEVFGPEEGSKKTTVHTIVAIANVLGILGRNSEVKEEYQGKDLNFDMLKVAAKEHEDKTHTDNVGRGRKKRHIEGEETNEEDGMGHGSLTE